jgi:glycosyltransferase involved in cell wall biosynthesis
MTDPLGQSQVIPYLSGLSNKGYDVHIISLEKPIKYENNKKQIQHLLSLSNIQWHPIPYLTKPKFVSNLKNTSVLKSKCFEVVRKYDIKLIHCRSYISAMIGRSVKRKMGIPFIFDMRGFWADERLDGGIWNIKNPIYKFIYKYFKVKEKQLLSAADHIVSLTKKGKEIIHARPGMENLPITVIPCCADLDFFNYHNIQNEERNDFRKKLNINPETLVLNYLGSWGTWYMPEEMMRCFAQLLQLRQDAVFLIITQDEKEVIFDCAKRNNVPLEKIFIRSAKRQEVPIYLAASDLAIFFIKPVYSKQASSPTKMGELMGMGLPLLCNAGVGDVEEIMQNANGLVINSFDDETLKNAVQKLIKLKDNNKDINRQCALQVYSLDDGIEKYAKIYQSILNGDDKDAP